MSQFFDNLRTRRYSAYVLNQSGTVKIPCELNKMDIRSGDSFNEVSFFVPFDDKWSMKNLPFESGVNNLGGEVVRIDLYGGTDKLAYRFYFRLTSHSFSNRGERRGIQYRAKDPLRLWAKGQVIYKTYNDVDRRDFFDNYKSNVGYWWTNSLGNAEFVEADPYSNNYLGLIDAWHAIIDIFYTPLRDLKARAVAAIDYPNIIFDPTTERDLKGFIIPRTDMKPSNMLTGIMSILQNVNTKYTVIPISKGPRFRDMTLLITQLGAGPKVDAVSNNNTQTTIEEFSYKNHNPRERIVVLKDESSINTDTQIDALKFKGAPRQYFVRHAPLIPAWDWWRDYDLFVRDANTMKLIPEFLPNNAPNPKWPAFLRNAVTAQLRSQLHDLANTYASDNDSPTNSTGRIYLFTAISALWKAISDAYSAAPDDERKRYIINLGVVDFLIKGDDPVHRYRFKRYVAVPPNTNSSKWLTNVDPKKGWDHPDLKRFKNILPVLVDGKRQNISDKYLSTALSRTDTHHLQFPVLIEAELPNYTESDGNRGQRPGSGEFGTSLEWKQIDTATVDGENGFFTISNPSGASLYVDRASVIVGYNLAAGVYKGLEASGGQPTNPDDDEREGYFKTWVMTPGGPAGVMLRSDYIHFRARLRASFYFTKEETLRINYSEPGSPKSHFDVIKKQVTQNDVWLSGILTPQDLEAEGIKLERDGYVDIGSSSCRFGFYEDSNMVWQTALLPTDPSYHPPYSVKFGGGSSGDQGILHSQIVTKDVDSGKVYIWLEWNHRDDRAILLKAAIRKLMEKMYPVYGGTITTLDVFNLGNFGTIGGSDGSLGMGRIIYNGNSMPISGYSVTFPNLTTQLEFDLLPIRYGQPYEPERITRIRAYEYFRKLNDERGIISPEQVHKDSHRTPRQHNGESYAGYREPWKAGKMDRYYHTPNYNYGRKANNIPGHSDNNPVIQVIESMANSILPTNVANREQAARNVFKAFPEAKAATETNGGGKLTVKNYNQQEGLV